MLSQLKIEQRQQNARENKLKSYHKHIENSEVFKRREMVSLFDRSYNIKENTIKINSHNTDLHELAKCILSIDLIKSGKVIFTEVIVCLEDNCIYEVVCSESKESVENKKLTYPLEVTFFKAEDVVNTYLNKCLKVISQ
jgi:hypothetical protein